ncbi:MAG: PQQ-binding-like beta-propeller repeat protein [Phycisphaera sp.]|nr:PQQ-binding-like beta-propeller repeat protein [Phycisphaera sp.]
MKSSAVVACLLVVTGLTVSHANAITAKDVLDATGATGGLAVHVGCADGALITELGARPGFVVQGLDADPAHVDAARTRVRDAGLYGKVTVDRLVAGRLPYIDNLVDLVVVDDAKAVTKDEVTRVLRPGGVAYLQSGGGWTKLVKPRPDDIDEWTHFLHDATGNAVSQDDEVGPPRRMQWQAGPAWLRNHHKLASISSVVTAKGRLFYIYDEAPASSMSIPPRWYVAARGAFNGVPLWEHQIPTWADVNRRFRSGPVQTQRTLVTDGDRVFVPLGVDAPVSALDAATGEVVRTYDATQHAEEILERDGVLYVVCGAVSAEQANEEARRGGGPLPRYRKRVVAVEVATGKQRWAWPDNDGAAVMPLTAAVDANGVYFQSDFDAVCLDPKTGKTRWQTTLDKAAAGKADNSDDSDSDTDNDSKKQKKKEPAGGDPTARPSGWSVATLVVRDGMVLLATGNKLFGLDAANGHVAWNAPSDKGFQSPPDVLVAGGLVWLGPDFKDGRDPKSGDVKKTTAQLSDVWTAGHHHRCYRNKATDNWLMSGKRGIEFFDLHGSQNSRNNWIRGVCQYGIMPSNGLIYAPSHACGCYMEAKLNGFWALAPEATAASKPAPGGAALETGPAYGKTDAAKAGPQDWPTYRHDATRSGCTTATLPQDLDRAWEAKLSGPLTAPVVADGKVLVAEIDAHRVVAVDAQSGQVAWSFTAGGRIDSPPTVHNGVALFGSADGSIYALRLADGALAWRFRAAPDDLRAVAYDQIESVWPVHGSILVQNGVAYATAGRSSYLDGGITLYAIDPATGKVLNRHQIENAPAVAIPDFAGKPRPIVQNAVDEKTFKEPDLADAFSMDGATSDVMVGDGQSVYLRHLRFDAKCEPVEQRGRHLFSTSQLLDDNESHRSHWVLGSGDFSRTPVAYSWIVNGLSVAKPKEGKWGGYRLMVPHGVIMCYDDTAAWPVKLEGNSYVLYSTPSVPLSTEVAEMPDFRKVGGEGVKTVGPTWTTKAPLHPRAILRAGNTIVLAGMPDDNIEAFEGLKGGKLVLADSQTGKITGDLDLPAGPARDGMAAANGKLFITTVRGELICLGAK